LDGRGINLIVEIIQNPNILFIDASTAARLSHLILGLDTLVKNPIGYGAGTTQIYSPDFINYGLFQFINLEYYSLSLYDNYRFLSLLGSLLFAYGIFGLFILLFLVSIFIITPILKKDNKLFKIAILFFVFCFFTILTSNPISYPFLWLLMGIFLNYFYYRGKNIACN
jgi:hypothetical protein